MRMHAILVLGAVGLVAAASNDTKIESLASGAKASNDTSVGSLASGGKASNMTGSSNPGSNNPGSSNPSTGATDSPGAGTSNNSPTEPLESAGPFKLYGCVPSSNGLPGFKLVGSSEKMDANLCAASCPSKFMGLYSTDCYCGQQLDGAANAKVPISECSTPCASGKGTCGGLASTSAKMRRQAVPRSLLLTMYQRTDAATNGADNTETGTGADNADGTGNGNGNGGNGSGSNGNGGNGKGGNGNGNGKGHPTPTPKPTYTKTITSTTTGTITTCPPEVTSCPVGQKTTGVTTITTTYCPEPTPNWESKKITCYGDYCAPAEHCEECERQRVVCKNGECYPEVCPNEDKYHNQLVECNGEDCKYSSCVGEECEKKVICYDGVCLKEQCFGDECEKNFVCEGEQCQHEQCTGEECYSKIACTNGECQPQPPCTENCPVPPPPAPPAPVPCTGPACPPAPVPCTGPQCPPPAPPCTGPECPPPAPPAPCTGPECPPPVVCNGPGCPPSGPVIPAPFSPQNKTVVVGAAAGSNLPIVSLLIGVVVSLAVL